MSEDRGWFADESDDEDRLENAPWQPFVQLEGLCMPLPIWFATEPECTFWIIENLPYLGKMYER